MKMFLWSFLFIVFLNAITFAQKNVAVLEIERRPEVAEEISRGEAMEITGVIRSAAVRVLPRGQFSVMTSETVQAMGGAALAECFDETCVIALGRTIDAEYVVRGVLSKFRTMFTLNIEMFETEYGNLVATSAPVRSENLVELLSASEAACVEMYRNFAGAETQPSVTPPSEQRRGLMSVGIQGAFRNNFGGGVERDATGFKMPYYSVGFNAFFDINYVEISIGLTSGSSEDWTFGSIKMDGSIISIDFGLLGKYPIYRGNVVVFPAIGISYQLVSSLKLDDAGIVDDASDVSRWWIKFGGGLDLSLSDAMFLRATVLYGVGFENKLEDDWITHNGGTRIVSHGLDIRAGIGFRF